MSNNLGEALSRLESRADKYQCTVDELITHWLNIDDNYEIEKLVLFAEIVQEIPVSIIVTDANYPDNPIIYANKASETLTGYSSNESIGQSLHHFLNVDADQSALDKLKRSIVESHSCNLIIQSYRKDGKAYENEIEIKPLFVDQSKATHFLAVQQDVTTRQVLLRESELHRTEFSSLLNDPSNAVLVADNEGYYVDCNAVACQLFGVEKKDLIGNSIANFVILPEKAPIENVWANFLETGYEEGEIEIRRPDSSLRTLQYRAYANYRAGQHISFLSDITEQKRVQSALEKTAVQLRLITEVAATYALTFKVLSDGTLEREWLTPNEFEKITGYSPEEAAARGGWASLPHPDDLGIVQQALTRLLTDTAETQTEFRAVTKSGDIRYIASISRSIKDDSGKVTHIYSTGRDITEQKMAQKALERSEEQFRRLIETAPIAIVVINSTGQIVFINSRVENLFGYEQDELMGMSIEILIPEYLWEKHKTHRAKFFDQPNQIHMNQSLGRMGHHKSGSSIPVEISLSYYDSEDGIMAVAFITDATERNRTLESLAYSAALIQSSHDAIIGKTIDGTIVSWNPGAENIYGYTKEEVVGKSISILVPEGRFDEVPTILNRIKAGEKIDHYETVRVRKDGTKIDISLTISPIQNAAGIITGASVIARNITERKQQEEIRQQQFKLLSKVMMTVPDIINIWNISEQRIVYANRSILEFLGYTSDEAEVIAKQGLLPILHPDDMAQRSAHRKAFSTAKDGDIGEFQYRIRDATGQWHWLAVRETVFSRDTSGSPVELLGAIQDISARKYAEKALEESERLYRLLADNVIDVIVQIDEMGSIIYISPSVELMMGYSVSEWVGRSILERLHPDDVPKALQEGRELGARGGGTIRASYRMRHQAGHYVWIELDSRISVNTKDALSVSVWRDITDRKLAEQALYESERFALATVDALSAHIAILDQNGNILTVNKAWRTYGEANGISPDYLWEGLNYLDVCDSTDFSGVDAQNVADGIRAVVKGEFKIFEYEYPCHSPNKQEWFIVRVTPFSNSAPINVVVAHENITVRKQSEEALRQSQNLLEKITNTAPFGVYIYDVKERRDIYNNERLLKNIEPKESREAQKEAFYGDYVHPDDQKIHLQHQQRLMSAQDGEIIESEIRTRNRQGEYQWLYFRDTVFARDAEGKPLQFIGSMQDITERKLAEEKIAFYREHLEELVAQRTAELAVSNKKLQIEMNERRIAEASEREQRILAEALRNVAVALNKQHDLDAVLDEIMLNIGYIVVHDSASLMLIESDVAHVVHAYGLVDNDMFLEGKEIRLSDSQILTAMHAIQEPLLIGDVYKNPLGVLLSQAPEGRSFIGVPLINAGRVIGFISLFSNTPDYFTQTSVSRLKMFAEQTAVAITNAQLYKQSSEMAVWRERQQIARNLHDAVTQTMFSASIITETLLRIHKSQPDRVQDGLVRLNKLTRGAVAEARNLLFELRPESLEDADLRHLIMQLCDAFEGKTGIKPIVHFDSEVRISSEIKITLYWITQEALNNIEKHAKASEVNIEFTFENRQFSLRIRDNGHGFITSSTNSTQLGLKIMYERAESINASIRIDSHLNQGTLITVIGTESLDG